jgi:hypothetical protein
MATRLVCSFLCGVLLSSCESPATDVASRTSAVTEVDAAVDDAAAAVTIQTDRSDYRPGDTAQITGSGFVPGEAVTLQVQHSDGTAEGGAGHEPWNVVADDGGSVTSEWFVNPDDSAGSAFVLSADSASGLHAETRFTDSFCTADIQCLPTDFCLAGLGCVGKRPVNASCSAHNQCFSDNCIGGHCVSCAQVMFGQPPPFPCNRDNLGAGGSDHNVCTNDSCNPFSGLCQHLNNSLPCDDGNRCTTGDVCVNGTCTPTGSASGCVFGNGPCTQNTDCQSGRCLGGHQCQSCSTYSDCPAGPNPCVAAVCVNGVCGTPSLCDDANPCTNDFCNAPPFGTFQGCQHGNVAFGVSCDDGKYCNGTDICNGAGACTNTGDPCQPLNNSDSNCASSCNESTRTCTANDPLGTPCNDGSACTVIDNCSNGVCVGGPDTLPPSISCPGTQTAECTSPSGAAVAFPAPTASDNCAGVMTACAPSSGSTFALGLATDTCTATDPSGNHTSCSFQVSVVDTTRPTITIAGANPVTVECATPFVDPGATADDACAGNRPVTTTGSVNTGLVGGYTLTYSASDPSGNSNSATRTVTVVDTTPPQVTCPAPITVECTADRAAAASFTASAADTCVGPVPADCSPPSGSSFALGANADTCSASDGHGNTGSCGFTVTVVDTTPPEVSCPAPITVECTANAAAPVSFSASAADTCVGPLTPTCAQPSGSSFALGTTADSCSAGDGNGNTGSCGFTVTVIDTTPPVFDATPTTQAVAGNCTGAPIGLPMVPTASDACQPPIVTCGTVAGNAFGSHTITCTATDPSGNVTTRDYTLTVVEPLAVVFQTPLVGPPMKNPVVVGSTLPHKIKLFNCAGADVTNGPYAVKLGSVLEAGSSGGIISSTPLQFSGVGDTGGNMYLVQLDHGSWVWQYNVKTSDWVNTTTGAYASDEYKDTASASYTAYPGIAFTGSVLVETTK